MPLLEKAAQKVAAAAMLVIIGTSMQVYPAANLIQYVKNGIPIYFVDPKPAISKNYCKILTKKTLNSINICISEV